MARKTPRFYYRVYMKGGFSPLADVWAQRIAAGGRGDSGYAIPEGIRDIDMTFSTKEKARESRAYFADHIKRLHPWMRTMVKLGPVSSYGR